MKIAKGISDESKRSVAKAKNDNDRRYHQDTADDYAKLVSEYKTAGKIYLDAHKELMSANINSISSRNIKKIYKKAASDGWRTESYPAYEFLSD